MSDKSELKTNVKNTSDFHPRIKGNQVWREPKEWQPLEDSELRSMMVRLGTKNPENYQTRQDMILELSKITTVLEDGKPLLQRHDWNGYKDTELRNMLVRLGTKNPQNYATRNEMISKLDTITKVVGRNKSLPKKASAV